MESVDQVMAQLKKKGNPQTVKIYSNHGAPADNMFGVKVGDLKPIAKKIKGNQELALELYETGNSDAMYLSGLVTDGSQMTMKQLDSWAKSASWYMIAEYTVPGVASQNSKCRQLALKWMKARKETVASCGWATYSGMLAVQDDSELDLGEIKELLEKVETDVHQAKNRVRYTMNGFVIATGTYVIPLLKEAKRVAKAIGKVHVEMGTTSCKVPLATEYIAKVEKMGRVGKKRKTIVC